MDPLVIALLVLAGVALLVLLALVVQRRRRRGTLKVISAGPAAEPAPAEAGPAGQDVAT